MVIYKTSRLMPKREWWGEMDDAMGLGREKSKGAQIKQLCSSLVQHIENPKHGRRAGA